MEKYHLFWEKLNKSNNKTSTGTSSQVPIKKWYKSFFEWLLTWWPAAFLFLAIVIAGFTKYIIPKENVYQLMIQIIKSIGVIMAVFYVIYTRSLALETKKMAIASMGMYDSEKGTVLTELSEGNSSFDSLIDDVKKITKEIHLVDKKLSESEFDELMRQNNLPAILLKIKNRSGRRIDLSKIEFSVRHTGSDNRHDINCNISKMGNIGPWEDAEICLIVSPEGEVEINIYSIDYLDGGVVQRKSNLDNKLVLDRIRKPEVTNG